MSFFDIIKSLFTRKEKVIDMSTVNRDSFKLIATDAIESFNKEMNCYLEIKRARKRKVVAEDKKYSYYGRFILTLEDSKVEVAFKSAKMIYNGYAMNRMLTDLNNALQFCDVYNTTSKFFVVRKLAYIDVNDVEGSKNEMKKSLEVLLKDVNTIIDQKLPWPRTIEYDDDEDTVSQKSYSSYSSSYSSSSSSSGTTKIYSSSSSPKKKTEDSRKKSIKDEIESYKRQKEECDRQIKHYQEQNKGIKDKHTKEVNKAQIEHWRQNKENLNKLIERAKERLQNIG